MLFLTIKLLHLLAIALGVGGAIASDVLFFKSIKDKKISKDESGLLTILSRLLWVGLILFIISGAGFILIQYIEKGEFLYFNSEPFLAKLSIFVILLANAFVFHLKVFPIIFGTSNIQDYIHKVRNNIKLISIVGSISIVSWMYILVLGTFRSITVKYLSFMDVMFIYTVLLLIAYYVSKLFLTKNFRE